MATPGHQISGRIKPVSAFRENQGHICRHVIYLAFGAYEKKIEGEACRDGDGHWSISG
jgi:surface antigen